MPFRVFLAMTGLVLAGCAVVQRASAQERAPDAPARPRPLAALAARHVLVLPTQYLARGDSLGWAAQIQNRRDYLGEVDAEIAFALSDRGVKQQWVFPDALEAAAKRNPTYAPDPYDLAAQWLRPPMRRAPDQLPEPFGSQVRTLIALEDDARYLFVPVEIRFESAGKGAERAVLRVALIDARMERIVWMGDVRGDPSTSFSRALAASAADHLADLVAAP